MSADRRKPERLTLLCHQCRAPFESHWIRAHWTRFCSYSCSTRHANLQPARREKSAARLRGGPGMFLKHAESTPPTPEYTAWRAMKRRCVPGHPQNARHYADRGISVCERWAQDYEAFLADMGRKPSPQHSLDRINNDGNYEPGNCRWATTKTQARNTRRNVWLTFGGELLLAIDLARILGVSHQCIEERIRKFGRLDPRVFEPRKQARRDR